MRYTTLIVREGGMPWHKTGATYYYAQLGLPDKGSAIKELVDCLGLLNLLPEVIKTTPKKHFQKKNS